MKYCQTFFPKWLFIPFILLSAAYDSSHYSIFISVVGIVNTLNFNYSSKCVLMTHYNFNCISLMTNVVEHLLCTYICVSSVDKYLLKYFDYLLDNSIEL